MCSRSFYYRIGQWQRHKSVMEGVEQALAMHFPEKLTNILYEYYGKLRHPQTPESALIHMVDALIVRLDHIKTMWQTVNGITRYLLSRH